MCCHRCHDVAFPRLAAGTSLAACTPLTTPSRLLLGYSFPIPRADSLVSVHRAFEMGRALHASSQSLRLRARMLCVCVCVCVCV